MTPRSRPSMPAARFAWSSRAAAAARHLRQVRRCGVAGAHGARSGSIAVETAVLTPMILLLLAGVVDYGLAVRDEMALAGAVRAGIQYALRDSTDVGGIEAAVRDALAGEGVDITVQVAEVCGCPDGSAIACSDACASGARRVFLRITASRPYATLVSWPGIASPTTLMSEAQVRIQ